MPQIPAGALEQFAWVLILPMWGPHFENNCLECLQGHLGRGQKEAGEHLREGTGSGQSEQAMGVGSS